MCPSEVEEKSCDSQLFSQGEQAGQQNQDQLIADARKLNTKITNGERNLTRLYWQLGMLLTLMRKNFERGLWSRQIKSLHIDKTRSSKSIAIFETFPSPDELAKLTVNEAYALRKRRSNTKSKRPALRKLLNVVNQRVNACIEAAIGTSLEDAVEVFPALDELLGKLEQFREHLHGRAGNGTAESTESAA